MSYIFPSGSSQGLLFSNHAVVLCSCWHLLCLGFWPTGFENVLSLREVFVGSCFPSFTLSSLWRYTEYSSNVDLPLLLKFCLLHLPPDTHCEFRPMSRLPILQPVCAAPPPPRLLKWWVCTLTPWAPCGSAVDSPTSSPRCCSEPLERPWQVGGVGSLITWAVKADGVQLFF